jgi:hypothetical protein
VQDLLLSAKHLFGAAKGGKLSRRRINHDEKALIVGVRALAMATVNYLVASKTD